MTNPIKWVELLNKIYSDEPVSCPICGSHKVEHRFYAEKQIGCAQFECKECGETAHLSRVKFPEYVKTNNLS